MFILSKDGNADLILVLFMKRLARIAYACFEGSLEIFMFFNYGAIFTESDAYCSSESILS